MTQPYVSRQQVSVWFFLAVMGLTVLTALGFLYLGKKLAPGSNLPAEELKILSRAYERIDQHYIYDLSKERRAQLLHAAVSGMIEQLDDYSRYYPPQKSEAYNIGTRGIMTGIGVIVQTHEKQVVLLYPIPDGPAERAGLKVGDVITEVDGKRIKTSRDAVKIIKGELGTTTTLTILRGDPAEKPAPTYVEVERDTVIIPSLKWARILDKDKGIGYVYLEKFTENSAQELDLTLQHLDGELGPGRRLSGLVFDLRQNPGGLLETCLEVTNRFLEEGKLVTLKRRNIEDVVYNASSDKCTRKNVALALIIDGGSASASEVFAGALKDHGRARLVGTRSFGKGVVQSVFSWKDRKERVKITTSYYLTPAGRNIENLLRPENEKGEGGIPPDIEVEFEKEQDQDIATALLHRREVPRKYRAAVDTLSERRGIRVFRPLGPDEDVQLGAALEEVRGMLLVGNATTAPAGQDRDK